MSATRMPKQPKVDGHEITYFGSEHDGYGWQCSCGADSGTPFVKISDRRYDAIFHLNMAVRSQN